MADLAEQLARHFAAQALAMPAEPATMAPQSEPTPEPESSPDPEPLAIPAPAATRPRLAGPSLRVPSCKSIHPALIFTHLVATMRACITLENQLANGTAAATASAAPLPPRHDPRREKLLEGFRIVTKNHANRAELLRATTVNMDEKLAADPDQTMTVPDLLWDISQELKIFVDLAQLPDEFLPPAKNSDKMDIKDLIEHCATYPPNRRS